MNTHPTPLDLARMEARRARGILDHLAMRDDEGILTPTETNRLLRALVSLTASLQILLDVLGLPPQKPSPITPQPRPKSTPPTIQLDTEQKGP